jgi:hypothetical protein
MSMRTGRIWSPAAFSRATRTPARVARDVLIATDMRAQHFITVIVRIVPAVALTCIAAAAVHAQSAQTFSASARVTSAGGTSVESPFSMEIKRFATDAERDALVRTISKGGTDAAQQMLARQAAVGTLQLGGRTVPVKYAYARAMGSGRLITAVTGEPIVFLGAGMPEAKPKAGYSLALVMLEVSDSGPGQGELVPAAKVRIDAQNAVVTEDYSPANVIRLVNVAKK